VTRDWWRRNRLALVVLAPVVPALVFVLLGLPLIDDAVYSPDRRTVASGEAVEANGWRFEVIAAQEFPGGTDADAIPAGSSITAALVEVTPLGPDSATDDPCGVRLVDASRGAEEREWQQLIDPLVYRYAVGDSSAVSCDLSVAEPFTYEAVFLTPPGLIPTASLEVRVFEGLRSTEYRFDLG